MTDVVTKERRLSLTGRKPRISPVSYTWLQDHICFHKPLRKEAVIYFQKHFWRRFMADDKSIIPEDALRYNYENLADSAIRQQISYLIQCWLRQNYDQCSILAPARQPEADNFSIMPATSKMCQLYTCYAETNGLKLFMDTTTATTATTNNNNKIYIWKNTIDHKIVLWYLDMSKLYQLVPYRKSKFCFNHSYDPFLPFNKFP